MLSAVRSASSTATDCHRTGRPGPVRVTAPFSCRRVRIVMIVLYERFSPSRR